MYIEATNTAVICIPKNGTHTFEHAVNVTYPDQPQNLYAGHGRASRIKQLVQSNYGAEKADTCVMVAMVREPSSRFVSALNHRWAGTKEVDLDEALDRSFKATEDFVFMPQVLWLDCSVDRQRLFLSHKDVLEYIGFKGEIPHLNKSEPRWTVQDLMGHALFPIIQEKYKSDYELYKDVKNGRRGT